MTLLSGGRNRKGISVAAAVAVVCVVAVAGGAVYLYPLISGGNTTITSTPTTTGQTGWQAWAVANITLSYYKTQSYIHNAYNYSFFAHQTGCRFWNQACTNGSSPVLVSALVEVEGPLIIHGNWTTGYQLKFAYVSTLNVSVRYTPPGQYQILRFSVQNQTNLANQGYWTITYDSTEQGVISTAMANSSVKSYLSQFPSYVGGGAGGLQAGGVQYCKLAGCADNMTYSGNYEVQLYQDNGARILYVFVNPNTNLVVAIYHSTRAVEQSCNNHYCYTTPWGG